MEQAAKEPVDRGGRVLIALGGNAMTGSDGNATAEAQSRAVAGAMEHVADLVASGVDVVLTHGNGPQVGNLLTKNEIAADVVPPVPLDWCGAQTQSTIGLLIANSLERALAAREVRRRVAVVVTRTLVDADDPGFAEPTKPIGRYVSGAEARALAGRGQVWRDFGERGWRRVVASPEPKAVVDDPSIESLVSAGFIVVACGGGGVPVVHDTQGGFRGVEGVIDKDLAAALLARAVGAATMVIATDVEHAFVGYGTSRARPLERVGVAELRSLASAGHFASGSMGPKVEAALRFVEGGGRRAAITSLNRLADAVTGKVGTVVEPE